jgi:dipeptidyl aminopeptidase/acylaminoacyl peptidase
MALGTFQGDLNRSDVRMKGVPMADGDLPPTADPWWVARQRIALDELSGAGGALWWLQSSPRDAATRLVRLADGVPGPVSPAGFGVGGRLHGYGGGNYAVSGGIVWLAGGPDSGLYRLDLAAGKLKSVRDGDGFRYGDLQSCPGGVLAVRECEDGDELVLVDDSGEHVRVLAASPGFLGAPQMRGRRLAFLEWDVDQAPWDGSRLAVARRTEDGSVEQAKLIAGGAAESVVQPAWGPDGLLYYMSDCSGFWNLYRWDGRVQQPVAPVDRDCAAAPWEAGYRSYAFLSDGRIALTFQHGLSHGLALAGADGTARAVGGPLTYVKPCLAAAPGGLAVIGSAAAGPSALCGIDLASGAATAAWPTAAAGDVHATAREARRLPGGSQLRFALYRPAGAVSGRLPLIVRVHPGPTDEVRDRLDWTREYFLAHGFAVAEPAYRGSAGLGRAWRTSLNGHWGDYDVRDCLAVAEALLGEGTVRPGAVFMSGASAGGYTALQAACVPGSPLTAVTAVSAITDPMSWAGTAPRFQRPHARALAGPAGPVRAGRVRVPVLLVHGRADDVAPVADAERLAGELRGLDPRHRGLFFDGAGHYLAGRALAEALGAELAFYRLFLS